MYYNKQVKDCDCGAATAATVFGIPYPEAFDLCKTTNEGTVSRNVFAAAKLLNNDSILIYETGELKDIWWLKDLSKKYPIYLGLNIKRQIAKRGRPRLAHHAVALIGAKIYDPADEHEIDIDIFCDICKSCIVNSIIVFAKELDTYGKNK